MKIHKILLIIAVCLVFCASETFAQCGADGTQPCSTSKKKSESKKVNKTQTNKVTSSTASKKKASTSTLNLLNTLWVGNATFDQPKLGEGYGGTEPIRLRFNPNGEFQAGTASGAVNWGSGRWTQNGNMITVEGDLELSLKVSGNRIQGKGRRLSDGLIFILINVTRR